MKNIFLLTCALVSLWFGAARTFAQTQTNIPGLFPPVENELPDDAVVKESDGDPPAIMAPAAPAASPSLAASFLAVGDDGDPLVPPDVAGAVGPNHIVTMHNTLVRIQDRTGATKYNNHAIELVGRLIDVSFRPTGCL